MENNTRSSQNITQMMKEWSGGNRNSLARLLPLIYDELRRERPGHTLQTTALIHEAYQKLIDQKDVRWQNRAHFFAIASVAMRRILVDYVRESQRVKRGGSAENLPIGEAFQIASKEKSVDLIALDEALTRLAKFDERQARIVELRYFSGLSIDGNRRNFRRFKRHRQTRLESGKDLAQTGNYKVVFCSPITLYISLTKPVLNRVTFPRTTNELLLTWKKSRKVFDFG